MAATQFSERIGREEGPDVRAAALARCQYGHNWIVGVGLAVFGTVAYGKTWARYVTAALAIWLFAFSALTDADPRTLWNDAMVAVLVFILSLLGPKKDWLTPASSRPSSAHG